MTVDLRNGSTSRLYTLNHITGFSYGANYYLDDFSGILMQDYSSGANDYVIERFSNGEKKQIIKNA